MDVHFQLQHFAKTVLHSSPAVTLLTVCTWCKTYQINTFTVVLLLQNHQNSGHGICILLSQYAFDFVLCSCTGIATTLYAVRTLLRASLNTSTLNILAAIT